MKRIIVWVAVIVVSIGGLLLLSKTLESNKSVSEFAGIEATVYMSPTCGCCKNYAQYLRNKGFDVKSEITNDMDSIKNKYGIPENLTSCHTTIIGKYIVEGHIPVEAIKNLLDSNPEIRGIAMAAMPSASPGMPGKKLEPFKIYKLTTDNQNDLFMTL